MLIKPMSNRSCIVLLSPIVVLVLGYAAARISGHLWGAWSWIPVTLVYWITLALIIACAGGWTRLPSMAATVTRRMGLASSVIRDNCAFHSGVSPQLPLAQSHLGLPLRLSILG